MASLHNGKTAVAWALIRKNELAYNHSCVHLSIHVLVYKPATYENT